jgi:Family of unknown function (DUF5681)
MAKWQKGQSGNLSGRPKSPISIGKELRKQLAETDPSTGKLNIEVIVAAWVRRGKRGEPKALEMIADRVDGKVVQPMKLDATIATREERLGKLKELLTALSAPEEDGHSDPRIN